MVINEYGEPNVIKIRMKIKTSYLAKILSKSDVRHPTRWGMNLDRRVRWFLRASLANDYIASFPCWGRFRLFCTFLKKWWLLSCLLVRVHHMGLSWFRFKWLWHWHRLARLAKDTGCLPSLLTFLEVRWSCSLCWCLWTKDIRLISCSLAAVHLFLWGRWLRGCIIPKQTDWGFATRGSQYSVLKWKWLLLIMILC